MDRSNYEVDNLGRDIKSSHYDVSLVNNQENVLVDQVPDSGMHQRLIDMSANMADSAADIFLKIGPLDGPFETKFSIGADSNDPSPPRPLHDFVIHTDMRVRMIGVLKGAVLPSPGDIDNLVINVSGSTLAVAGKVVKNVFLSNAGLANITISKMTVSWTIPTASPSIDQIHIEGTKVWDSNGTVGSPTGVQVSGVTIDIVDTVIVPGAPPVELEIFWDSSMVAATVDAVFEMSDESIRKERLIGDPGQLTRVFGELVYANYKGSIGG